MLPYEEAKAAMDLAEKECMRAGPTVDPNYRGHGVQLEFVVEDHKMFTMPWSASITYLKREHTDWEERICAENVEHDYNFNYFSDNAKLPAGRHAGFLRRQFETVLHPLRARAACRSAAGSRQETILFVGNSFTYGELSPVKTYKANTVTDLNRSGVGGVPALFKAFAAQAGLDYDVSLETVPGVGLDYHYAEKRPLLDRSWDEVVLQSFSTLDQIVPAIPRCW